MKKMKTFRVEVESTKTEYFKVEAEDEEMAKEVVNQDEIAPYETTGDQVILTKAKHIEDDEELEQDVEEHMAEAEEEEELQWGNQLGCCDPADPKVIARLKEYNSRKLGINEVCPIVKGPEIKVKK